MSKTHTPEWIELALKRTSSDFVNPKNLWKGRLITRSEYIIGYLIGEDILVGDVVDMTEDYCTTEFWARVEPSTLEKVIPEINESESEKLRKLDLLHHPFKSIFP